VIQSLSGVLDVQRYGSGPARLLVEVPHGADRRAHYEAVRARLVGDMPADLHTFFHINTDVGAWQLGDEVARRVHQESGQSVIVIRSLLPRTFIDCNRLESATATAGLTAGLAPWIRHPADQTYLLAAHRQYVAVVAAAVDEVIAAGGILLLPHTYGPRSMDIAEVGDDIVARLHEQVEPRKWASLPLRPEIDLITRTPDGELNTLANAEEFLFGAYCPLGIEVTFSHTYTLHPVTMGARWATAHPDRALCLEVRRDLLVEKWLPFEEMVVDPVAVKRMAGPLVMFLAEKLA
jgi:hypothetical protein